MAQAPQSGPSKNTKLIAMFLPLLLFIGGWFWLLQDLKNPTHKTDECKVVGKGTAVSQLKKDKPLLYRQSDSEAFDVGLSCTKLGTVIINDQQAFEAPLDAGKTVYLDSKEYQYLPTLWSLSVKS